MNVIVSSKGKGYVCKEGVCRSLYDAKQFAEDDRSIDGWLTRARGEFPEYGFYVVHVPDILLK